MATSHNIIVVSNSGQPLLPHNDYSYAYSHLVNAALASATLAARPPAASTSCNVSPTRSTFVHPPAKGASARIGRQNRFRRRSASTAAAALYPGAPVTPPPGWAPEPQR